jgi:electron transfer flavoprotein beta subunit
MRIVVAVKAVAQLDDELAIDDAEYDVNEWDRFSLELALSLREQAGGEVVVLSLGGDEAEEVLRAGLAVGADRGVRVRDDGLEGADVLMVASILAAAIRRERADLVLTGVQSSDAANGATGVAVAAHLDLPRVAVVRRVDLAGDVLTVERELEGGVAERLTVGLPALLTIQTGINEPRYATLRAIKQAADKPLTVVGLAELDLDAATLRAAAGIVATRLTTPDAGEGAVMLGGGAGAAAERVAAIIRDQVAA